MDTVPYASFDVTQTSTSLNLGQGESKSSLEIIPGSLDSLSNNLAGSILHLVGDILGKYSLPFEELAICLREIHRAGAEDIFLDYLEEAREGNTLERQYH